MKMGALLYGPRGTAASRRAIKARERGPGISVRICIVGISVPPNRSFFEVHARRLASAIHKKEKRSQSHKNGVRTATTKQQDEVPASQNTPPVRRFFFLPACSAQ